MAEPTSARRGGSGTEVVDGTVTDDVTRDAAPAPTAQGSTDPGTGPGVEAAVTDQGSPAAAAYGDLETGQEHQGPVIRDKRRLDPQTGQVRAAYAATEPSAADAGQQPVDHVDLGPAGVAGHAAPAAADGAPSPQATHQAELDAARAVADERLLDLQRLQAEFVNYRRRVDRDRDVAREAAVASVLEALLPVLDDVHLARRHGDLEGGPFAAIAEKLESTLGRFGLLRYGEPGEPFDPKIHEALLHADAELAEGTTEPTVVQILQPGYRAGERVLRAARVAVADPQ
jgi:molecular chaperone GrpE